MPGISRRAAEAGESDKGSAHLHRSKGRLHGLFTAIVETGYGPVLQEAKKAHIPVIMIDHDVAKEARASDSPSWAPISPTKAKKPGLGSLGT